MNRFFVENKTYKERLNICRSCEHYFNLTGNCKVCGCFMRVKASISFQECPKKYWLKTNKIEPSSAIPEHLIQEIKDIYPKVKNGVADSVETTKQLVELHNTIYNTNYNPKTSCGSCLHSILRGIKTIYEKL